MKDRRIFIISFILLLGFVLLVTLNLADKSGQVEPFRGARLESTVFNPLISKNLNKADVVKLSIDGDEMVSERGEILLNNNMDTLTSLTLIRRVFYASSRTLSDGTIILERNDDNFKFTVGKKEGTKNKNAYKLEVEPEKVGDKVYFSMKDICRMFGYGYAWDNHTKVVSLDSTASEAPRLRKKFDLRTEGRTAEIKNQGSLSTCWAYAATSALESSVLSDQKMTFDAFDMAKRNTYKRKTTDPGNYMMAVSYLLSWNGPVVSEKSGTAKHLQEVHFFNQDDMDDIKWAVFRNGGVSTSIYAETGEGKFTKSDYYNSEEGAYYYYGNKNPNHDIVIIGWDDNYSAENFGHKCPGNGAFICQNSWGDKFGDDGVFYVSYYDTNIGNFGVSYVKLESNTNYDRIYQTDLCGSVGKVGFGTKSAMAANVYKADTNQIIKAAGFYNTSKDSEYEVYAVSKYENTTSLADRELVAKGSLHDLGYYTILFDKDIEVEEGDEFAIILVMKSKKNGKQIAIEYDGNSLTKHVDIKDGQGYLSQNGVSWNRIESEFDANICLKAYCDEKK